MINFAFVITDGDCSKIGLEYNHTDLELAASVSEFWDYRAPLWTVFLKEFTRARCGGIYI